MVVIEMICCEFVGLDFLKLSGQSSPLSFCRNSLTLLQAFENSSSVTFFTESG